MEKINNIADFNLHEDFLGVEHVDFKDVVGKEIIIDEVKQKHGQHGLFIAMKYRETMDGKPKSMQTGSKPIVEKCLKLVERKALPVICKVVSIKNYFDLASPNA